MGATEGVLSGLKRPEYTGANRCMPCTVVNLAIAVAGGLAVAAVGWTAWSPGVGTVLGLGFLALATASIYLRGYLVPGTPALTKRYLPERVLAWFGKAPDPPPVDDDLDPEAVLTALGALEECPDGQDLCLTDEFGAAWRDAMAGVAGTDDRSDLLDLLDLDDGDVAFEDHGDAVRASVDGTRVGTWQSEAALVADLGAGSVLADRDPAWHRRPVPQRGRLLNGLRLFLDRCPTCGGRPSFGTETVESCCSTHQVAAVECEDCGARLFETRT